MLNVFKMRKYAALVLPQLVSVVLFFVGLIYYDLVGGIIFFMIALVLGILIGVMLLRNPFTDMVEGAGILVIDMNSTGVLQPFIVRLDNPYIEGLFRGQRIKDIFNRDATQVITPPVIAEKRAKIDDKGGLTIELTKDDYNRNRFALFHYPVLVWNSNVKSFLTKDWFSEKEKSAFAEHTVLYLNQVMKELTTVVRDFGRHIVDNLRPQENSILGNKWVWIIIIIFIGVLAVMFAPAIMSALSGVSGTVSGAAGTAGGAVGAVVPR